MPHSSRITTSSAKQHGRAPSQATQQTTNLRQTTSQPRASLGRLLTLTHTNVPFPTPTLTLDSRAHTERSGGDAKRLKAQVIAEGRKRSAASPPLAPYHTTHAGERSLQPAWAVAVTTPRRRRRARGVQRAGLALRGVGRRGLVAAHPPMGALSSLRGTCEAQEGPRTCTSFYLRLFNQRAKP